MSGRRSDGAFSCLTARTGVSCRRWEKYVRRALRICSLPCWEMRKPKERFHEYSIECDHGISSRRCGGGTRCYFSDAVVVLVGEAGVVGIPFDLPGATRYCGRLPHWLCYHCASSRGCDAQRVDDGGHA